MKKNQLIKPFLKWAGGKRQLLSEIRKYIPKRIKIYFEPFLGGGAVYFDIQPRNAVINDINQELINVYKVIKHNVDDLIIDLSKHINEKEYYYRIRDLDRTEEYVNLSPVEKASRIIYLNRTCYNGLFRVNSQGHFNVPFGNYKKPNFENKILLKAVSDFLNKIDVSILNDDFETVLEQAKKGDFVYLDPPYDPISDTSSFTGYDLNGFSTEDQVRLKKVFDKLNTKGCKVLLSNSGTEFIKDLYKGYINVIVTATRAINSDATKRGYIEELLVMNYDNKDS